MAILIKRNQVDGLVGMKTLLDQIDTSYPASKITTEVLQTEGQTPEENVYYTGESLFEELKANVDNILDGGAGLSLPELKRLVDKLNAELNGGTYKDTQAQDVELTGFKNKQMNDVVRIEFNLASGLTATPKNAAQITEELEEEQNLTAYTIDGTVIVGSTGGDITFNFDTKTFSATPYVLDIDATKASGGIDSVTGQIIAGQEVYTLFTGDFKVFPVGTWTLETLPPTALLDNNELQLIAYDHALQKVILQLASDKQLIERITESVGSTAITEAVKDVTERIDTRIKRLEGVEDANLAKVAVKVSQINGAPANDTDTAETVTKTTVVPSKKYVDDVDNAIKADIGLAAATPAYDSNNNIQAGTVRSEINALKERYVDKTKLVSAVKTSSLVSQGEEPNVTYTKVTDDENTINETALVDKFAALVTEDAAINNRITTFADITAPQTYVAKAHITDTFTKINVVNNTYNDTYVDEQNKPVVGKKIFNEQISRLEDFITATDNVAYHYAAISVAPVVTANPEKGITAKIAENQATADTPVLSKTATEYLVTNEAEERAKAVQDLDDKTYDWNKIVGNNGVEVKANIIKTAFNATTGVVTDASAQETVVVAGTAETISSDTNVYSASQTDKLIQQAQSTVELTNAADKTELLNRIAYEKQLASEALTREVNRLTARAGDTLVTPADGSGAVLASAVGSITALDDKTADWDKITTSPGIGANITYGSTVLQAAVAAEATHTENTPIASTQYVNDKVSSQVANLKKDMLTADDAIDARVSAIEAIVPTTESIVPNLTNGTISLSHEPLYGSELIIFVNGLAYFLNDGAYTVNTTLVTWDSVAAGFSLADVLEIGGTVTARYRYSTAV